MCVICGTIRLAGQPFIYIPLPVYSKDLKRTLRDVSRPRFPQRFLGRSEGSFPEQRLVIEPTKDLSEK